MSTTRFCTPRPVAVNRYRRAGRAARDRGAGAMVLTVGLAGQAEVIARVRPGRHGRFLVTLPRGAGPALYSVRTRVRTTVGGRIATVSRVMLID
jgi:hypothetical protein